MCVVCPCLSFQFDSIRIQTPPPTPTHIFIVASDLLNYETGEEASEYFGSLLDETVTNDSFTEDVLSGESSDVFEGKTFLERLH